MHTTTLHVRCVAFLPVALPHLPRYTHVVVAFATTLRYIYVPYTVPVLRYTLLRLPPHLRSLRFTGCSSHVHLLHTVTFAVAVAVAARSCWSTHPRCHVSSVAVAHVTLRYVGWLRLLHHRCCRTHVCRFVTLRCGWIYGCVGCRSHGCSCRLVALRYVLRCWILVAVALVTALPTTAPVGLVRCTRCCLPAHACPRLRWCGYTTHSWLRCGCAFYGYMRLVGCTYTAPLRCCWLYVYVTLPVWIRCVTALRLRLIVRLVTTFYVTLIYGCGYVTLLRLFTFVRCHYLHVVYVTLITLVLRLHTVPIGYRLRYLCHTLDLVYGSFVLLVGLPFTVIRSHVHVAVTTTAALPRCPHVCHLLPRCHVALRWICGYVAFYMVCRFRCGFTDLRSGFLRCHTLPCHTFGFVYVALRIYIRCVATFYVVHFIVTTFATLRSRICTPLVTVGYILLLPATAPFATTAPPRCRAVRSFTLRFTFHVPTFTRCLCRTRSSFCIRCRYYVTLRCSCVFTLRYGCVTFYVTTPPPRSLRCSYVALPVRWLPRCGLRLVDWLVDLRLIYVRYVADLPVHLPRYPVFTVATFFTVDLTPPLHTVPHPRLVRSRCGWLPPRCVTFVTFTFYVIRFAVDFTVAAVRAFF